MKLNIEQIRYRRDLWKLFTKPGKAVEIGVAEGNFSEDMLKWTFKGVLESTIGPPDPMPLAFPVLKKLYMVDRWRSVPTQAGDAAMPPEWHNSNLIRVKERTRKYGKRAVILRGDSVEMAERIPDGSLTLVYVDGNHSYEGVFEDAKIWHPKVKDGGFMAFHDYLNPNYGVNQAVKDFCRQNGYEIHDLSEDKPEDAGAWFQVTHF